MHQIDRALNKILGHSSSARKTPPTLPVGLNPLSAFSFPKMRTGGKITQQYLKEKHIFVRGTPHERKFILHQFSRRPELIQKVQPSQYKVMNIRFKKLYKMDNRGRPHMMEPLGQYSRRCDTDNPSIYLSREYYLSGQPAEHSPGQTLAHEAEHARQYRDMSRSEVKKAGTTYPSKYTIEDFEHGQAHTLLEEQARVESEKKPERELSQKVPESKRMLVYRQTFAKPQSGGKVQPYMLSKRTHYTKVRDRPIWDKEKGVLVLKKPDLLTPEEKHLIMILSIKKRQRERDREEQRREEEIASINLQAQLMRDKWTPEERKEYEEAVKKSKSGGKINEQYLEKRGIDMGGYWVDEDKRPISEKYFKKAVRIFQRRPELIQRTVGTKILIRHPTEAYRAQFRPAESNTPEAIILTTDVLRGRMFKPEVRKRFEEIKRERELRGLANPIFVDAGEGAMEHELEHKRQYKAFPQEKLREQENQRIELEKKERERLGFPEWAKTEKEHNEQVKQYSPEYFKAIENLPIERLAHQTFYRTPEREKAQLVPEEQRMEAYRATMENPRSGGKFGHQYSFDNVGRKDIKTVWMQPSRFLVETKREFDERQKRNKDYPKTRLQTQEEYEREVLMPSHIAYLKKRIPSKTKEVAIPFLTYDRWGRPIEHEGRHTSAAARQLGLEKIPVTIEQRRYSREWEKPPSEGEVVNWQPIESFEGYHEQPVSEEYVYPSEIDYDMPGRKRSEQYSVLKVKEE